MKKDTNKNFKGFTMMETVVCLAVFAVTLAAAVPAFEGFNEKTDEHNFKSECKSILATAEVMAGESYKLGTDEAVLLAELQDQFPDCTIGNVVFEKGKVLSLEINRKENPRTMYYTDEGDFSTEKPADFERIKERSLARLAGFTPYEAPADPKIIPERTKPAVTTAPETVAATEPTTTTVTTPKPVTTVTTTTVTETEKTSQTTTPKVTETEKQVQTTIPKVTEPVVTTKEDSIYDVESLNNNDERLSRVRSYYDESAVINAVEVSNKSGNSFDYDVIYSLSDLGYDWGNLCGVGATFSSINPYYNSFYVTLGNSDVKNTTDFTLNENGISYDAYVSIDQYSLNAAPKKIKFNVNSNGPGELENIVFYFNNPAGSSVEEKIKSFEENGSKQIKAVNSVYYLNALDADQRNFKSISIIYKEDAYGKYSPGRNGYVYFDNASVEKEFHMTRKNEKIVTIDVDSSSISFFTIVQSSQYEADDEIAAVFLNY